MIKATFDSSFLDTFSGHDYIDLTVYDRPFEYVIDYNNTGSADTFGHFANTEFHAKRASNALLINVGESWTYGGSPNRQMCKNGTETAASFQRALTATFGAKLSHGINASLHQDAWPGNNTTYMFERAEAIIEQYLATDEYHRIFVALQITDPLREDSQFAGVKPEHHVHKMYKGCDPVTGQPKTWNTHKEWHADYERGFLLWAERLQALDPRVEAVVLWKNFSPWNVSADERAQYQCRTVDKCWVKFCAEYEGYNLPDITTFNPAGLDSNNQLLGLVRYVDANPDWVEQEVSNIEQMHKYWEYSGEKMSLCVNYPSGFAHEMWAHQIMFAMFDTASDAPTIAPMTENHFYIQE